MPYYRRDGKSNPDTQTVNNRGAFVIVSDAVPLQCTRMGNPTVLPTSRHERCKLDQYVVLANDMRMNPNLDYSQAGWCVGRGRPLTPADRRA